MGRMMNSKLGRLTASLIILLMVIALVVPLLATFIPAPDTASAAGWLADYDYRKTINVTAADPQPQTLGKKFYPIKDTYTYEALSSNNYALLNQLASWQKVGSELRSYLEFDLSSLPIDASITSAKLYLKYSNYPFTDPVGQTLYAYDLQNTVWVEGDGTDGVTWDESNHDAGDHPGSCTDWTDGGDFTTTNGVSDTFPAGFGWMDWTITTIVDAQYTDHAGIIDILLRQTTGGTTAYLANFYDAENATITNRPYLYITYTTTPSVPTNYKISVDIHAESPTVEEGSWNVSGEDCTWRVPITINTLDATSAGYDIKIIIDTEKLCDAGTDAYFGNTTSGYAKTVEFADSDGLNSMDYWVQSFEGEPKNFNTDNTRYWVEFPAQNASTEYNYYIYGSPLISGESSNYGGDKVFNYFEDFDVTTANLAAFLIAYPDWITEPYPATVDTNTTHTSALYLDSPITSLYQGIRCTGFNQSDFRALFGIRAIADNVCVGMVDAGGISATTHSAMFLFDSTTWSLRRYVGGNSYGIGGDLPNGAFTYELQKLGAEYYLQLFRDTSYQPDGVASGSLTADNEEHFPFIASYLQDDVSVDWIAITDLVPDKPIVTFPDILYSEDGVIFCEGNTENWPFDITFTDGDGSTELYHWADSLTELTKQPGDSKEFTIRVTDDLASNQQIYVYYGNSGVTDTHAYAINGSNTFDEYDTFGNGSSPSVSNWSTSGGTWSAVGLKMPLNKRSEVGNVQGGAGRAWFRQHQIIKVGENDYRAFLTNAEWDYGAGGWPTPYNIYIASGTSLDEEFGPASLLLTHESDGDSWMAGWVDSVQWSANISKWVMTVVSGGMHIYTAEDPDGPWTYNENGAMITGSVSYDLFLDDFTGGADEWYAFTSPWPPPGDNEVLCYRTYNLDPDDWDSSDWTLILDPVATLHATYHTEDLQVVKDPDTDMAYIFHTMQGGVHYSSLNTSDVAFPGNDVGWSLSTEANLGGYTLDAAKRGSPRLILEGDVWYLSSYGQGHIEPGTDAFFAKWIPNYTLMSNGSLPNTWTPTNLNGKYYQASTTAETFTSWVDNSNYTDVEIITEIVSTAGDYDNGLGIAFRYDTTSDSGYVALIDYNDEDPRLSLWNNVEGTLWQIGSYVDVDQFPLPTFYPGYRWRLRIQAYGSEITFSYSPWGNEWVEAMTETHYTYQSGAVGVVTDSAQAHFDDFRVMEYTKTTPVVGESSEIEYMTCIPTVVTNSATSIEETTSTLQGNITSQCAIENNIDSRGFVWDTSTHGSPGNATAPADSDYANYWTEDATYGTGTYSHGITSLTQGELYYNRACAVSVSSAQWGYGNEITFLTKPTEPNTLSAVDGTEESIDLTWVKGTGADNTEIWGQSGSYPAARGVGTLTYNSTGVSYTDTNPSYGETWYYRAWSFAAEGGLWQYSDTYDEDNATVAVTPPTVVTSNATLVEETWATLNGNITVAEINATIRGFQYDIDSGVPYSMNWTEGGSFGIGTYSYNITGLDEGELYYVSAIAYNVAGWGNGSELTFLTKPDEPTALLNTSRTSTSITMAWTVADGADRYIVTYNTSGYPTDYTNGTMTCNTSSSTCTATPLSSGQIHYIRVWSWCTEGGLSQWSDTYDELTAYTNPADITSFDAFNPSASTIDLSWIQGTGGDKTHIRGQQGSYPTNVSTGTQIYFDTGASTTHIGLGGGETWYYRAWAYDSDSGYYSDSYDQDFEVTTTVGAPTVVTIAASLVEETTATISGEVTVVNDTNITERGFQYDLDSAPPYTWNWTQNGTYGTGIFSYNMTSLTPGDLIYFRAQAENNNPTWGYGSELKFLTKPEAPIGLTSTNTTYNTITLSWATGNGSQKTMIRYATGDYPATYNDGTQGYFGNSNTTIVTALDSGYTYYIRAWSYTTEDALIQYSDSYSQVIASTTGSSAPADACSTNGVMALIVVAGAATVIPLAIKLLPLFIAGSLAWFGLGIYLVSASDPGSVCWILGWVCLAAGFICSFEFIRRMMKARTVRATEDEELDNYQDVVNKTLGE